MRVAGRDFQIVTLVDFEFRAVDGERPEPVCMVTRDLRTGHVQHWWQDELRKLGTPPYPNGRDALVVAYYASAELGCHLALGWPMPVNVLDLYVEFRRLTNGLTLACGNGLLGALAFFGLDGIDVTEKDTMRDLALRGGPWTDVERRQLLDYCQSDVDALARLLPQMEANLDLDRAFLRGRYMAAAARIEWQGVPIDTETFAAVKANWDGIQAALIREIDKDYGIYEGQSFRRVAFEQWLVRAGIPWPRLDSGELALDDDTFREMARSYPALAPLRELRGALSQLRLSDLAVGADGRNRCLLSAFSSRTSRNQPSNSKYIFGPSVWLRGLIRPQPGYGIAYVDWSQHEFGIAAALSGDSSMIEAYSSGDPYLAFAVQAGAAPPEATKASHGPVREQFKACVLGVQYAMGADSLSVRIGQPPARARELLVLHRQTYPGFWKWSDAAVDHAMLHGTLWTTFGWRIRTGPNVNARSLRNFPMQANGAEMLRIACILATERGVRICAPVHDAVLIEAPLDEVDQAVVATQKAMAEASRAVLAGFELRSDAKVFRYPERFQDERGRVMWATVLRLLGRGPAEAE